MVGSPVAAAHDGIGVTGAGGLEDAPVGGGVVSVRPRGELKGRARAEGPWGGHDGEEGEPLGLLKPVLRKQTLRLLRDPREVGHVPLGVALAPRGRVYAVCSHA